MPRVKKIKPISTEVIDIDKAIAAMEIYSHVLKEQEGSNKPSLRSGMDQLHRINEFERNYHHSYYDTIIEIWKWSHYIFTEHRDYSLHEIYTKYVICVADSYKEPMKIGKYVKDENSDQWLFEGYSEWIFNEFIYEVKGPYNDDEIKLLILEDFEKERKYFEKLKYKYDKAEKSKLTYERSRIPEGVRIEVWRRDGGKCARCGSREKLEYDHIVPVSKGGSNTARNIELLCEKCNRSKSNNIA